MELPPCPACGAELAQDSPRGRARCPECGFSTPVELDVAALQRLLLEASPSARELEVALSTRSPAADATRGRMRPATGPQGPRAGAPPSPPPPPGHLHPAPTRPAGIDARAPPPLSDPRAPMAPPLAPPATRMREARAEAEARRRRETSARGELLR